MNPALMSPDHDDGGGVIEHACGNTIPNAEHFLERNAESVYSFRPRPGQAGALGGLRRWPSTPA
jgi:hypothetical protein